MRVNKPYYNEDVLLFGQTNFRDHRKTFGLKQGDRNKHMFVIGKTGMGKTSMLENMIVQDIKSGKGVCVLDPNGKLIEQILYYIPKSRVNDVIYINPADLNNPVAFNLLRTTFKDDLDKQDFVNGLINVFKDVWQDVWSPRLEYVLTNAVLTLIEDENNTILHLLPLFCDKKFRDKLLDKVDDTILLDFWLKEYEESEEVFKQHAVDLIQDKIGGLASNPLVRNILGQKKTSFNFEEIINKQKIVLITLDKNKLGSDVANILGSCFMFLLSHMAMQLQGLIFPVYIDEFSNFTNYPISTLVTHSDSGLSMVLSVQYLEQIEPSLQEAIFGNVGTVVSFRVSAVDAVVLSQELQHGISSEDMIKLPKYTFVVKMLINGEVSKPFSATNLEPLPVVGLSEKIINYSRELYCSKLQDVETEIKKNMRVGKKMRPKKIRQKSNTPKPEQQDINLKKLSVFRKQFSKVCKKKPSKQTDKTGIFKKGIVKKVSEYIELKAGKVVKF